jgi:hypothetical protein
VSSDARRRRAGSDDVGTDMLRNINRFYYCFYLSNPSLQVVCPFRIFSITLRCFSFNFLYIIILAEIPDVPEVLTASLNRAMRLFCETSDSWTISIILNNAASQKTEIFKRITIIRSKAKLSFG